MEQTAYQIHGFDSRKEYLQNLAEEYDLDYSIVWSLAEILGPSEDFDGLISALEDAQEVCL